MPTAVTELETLAKEAQAVLDKAKANNDGDLALKAIKLLGALQRDIAALSGLGGDESTQRVTNAREMLVRVRAGLPELERLAAMEETDTRGETH